MCVCVRAVSPSRVTSGHSLMICPKLSVRIRSTMPLFPILIHLTLFPTPAGVTQWDVPACIVAARAEKQKAAADAANTKLALKRFMKESAAPKEVAGVATQEEDLDKPPPVMAEGAACVCVVSYGVCARVCMCNVPTLPFHAAHAVIGTRICPICCCCVCPFRSLVSEHQVRLGQDGVCQGGPNLRQCHHRHVQGLLIC